MKSNNIIKGFVAFCTFCLLLVGCFHANPAGGNEAGKLYNPTRPEAYHAAVQHAQQDLTWLGYAGLLIAVCGAASKFVGAPPATIIGVVIVGLSLWALSFLLQLVLPYIGWLVVAAIVALILFLYHWHRTHKSLIEKLTNPQPPTTLPTDNV